jgi:hypothetical protein
MFLAKILRLSYSEFLKMPTYIRRYLVNKIIDDNKKLS